MGHYFQAIAGQLPAHHQAVKKYELPVIEQSGFALVPLNASHLDYWTEKEGMEYGSDQSDVPCDCLLARTIANEMFDGHRFAFIYADYFGGSGYQIAVVYEKNLKLFEARSEVTMLSQADFSELPINKALTYFGLPKEVNETGKSDTDSESWLKKLANRLNPKPRTPHLQVWDNFRAIGLDRFGSYEEFFEKYEDMTN